MNDLSDYLANAGEWWWQGWARPCVAPHGSGARAANFMRVCQLQSGTSYHRKWGCQISAPWRVVVTQQQGGPAKFAQEEQHTVHATPQWQAT